MYSSNLRFGKLDCSLLLSRQSTFEVFKLRFVSANYVSLGISMFPEKMLYEVLN